MRDLVGPPFPVGQDEPEAPGTLFVFGGYSWRYQGFYAWRLTFTDGLFQGVSGFLGVGLLGHSRRLGQIGRGLGQKWASCAPTSSYGSFWAVERSARRRANHSPVPISNHTRRALWGQSGGVCARCRNTVIHDATPLDREALVGEEAHIVSAAPAGPRHGPEPDGGYDGLGNLILLCRVCHRLVDDQPQTYSADGLREMRARHVQWVRSRTGSGSSLPNAAFSALPDGLQLELVASGRQLVELLGGSEDIVFRHDQPHDHADAALMSEFLKRVEDADLEIEAIGAHHAVTLSQEFQELLLQQMLPLGLIVLGARAQRTLTVDGASTPWTTCVLSIRYAPRTSEPHGSATDDDPGRPEPDLPSQLQSLLAEGRLIRDKPQISEDGSSALVQIWERDVRRALTAYARHDLLERFEAADGFDAARFMSRPWATKRRLARELAVLAEFLTELAPSQGPGSG
jgi:hypothetical protein